MTRKNAGMFYVGKPCKYGHDGRRYKANAVCVQCNVDKKRTPEYRAYRLAYNGRPEVRAHATKHRRLTKYDMLPLEWNFMFAGQRHRCAICETDDPGGLGYWHTDHLHGTKTVRAILCHGCNTGLGHFKESPATLRAAADYLERYECPTSQQTTSPTPTDATDGQSNHWPNTAQVETQYIPLSLAM